MTTEEIILNKSWKELTATELEEVRELAADEASFNHMKSFMRQVGHITAGEVYEPSVSVKSGLDAVFAKQHAARMPQQESAFRAPDAKVVPLYQRNWTKIAAAVIFVGTAIIVCTWPGRQEIAPAPQIAKVEEPVVFSEWNPEKEKQAEAASDQQTERSKISTEKHDEVPENWSLDEIEAAPLASSTGYSYSTTSSYSPVETRAEAKGYNMQNNQFADSISVSTLKEGRNADLFPDSFYPSSVAAASEDLLSYIKPAF